MDSSLIPLVSQAVTGVTPTEFTRTAPLAFDVDKYRRYLTNTELSDEQQREYLEVLWNIMTTFVKLGFGLDPVQQVLPASYEMAPGD